MFFMDHLASATALPFEALEEARVLVAESVAACEGRVGQLECNGQARLPGQVLYPDENVFVASFEWCFGVFGRFTSSASTAYKPTWPATRSVAGRLLLPRPRCSRRGHEFCTRASVSRVSSAARSAGLVGGVRSPYEAGFCHDGSCHVWFRESRHRTYRLPLWTMAGFLRCHPSPDDDGGISCAETPVSASTEGLAVQR